MSNLRLELRDVSRGYAEVWAVTDEHPDLADIGTVERQSWRGRVSGADYTKWLAHRSGRGSEPQRVGIHYATRDAAANALFKLFVVSIGRKARREYGITLKEVGL